MCISGSGSCRTNERGGGTRRVHFAIQSRAVGCIEIKCRSTARTNKEGKKEMAIAYKYIYALYYDYESEAQLPPLAYSTALLSSSEKERAQHQQRVAEKRARKNDCVAPFLLLLLRLLSPTHARIADECTANQKKESAFYSRLLLLLFRLGLLFLS